MSKKRRKSSLFLWLVFFLVPAHCTIGSQALSETGSPLGDAAAVQDSEELEANTEDTGGMLLYDPTGKTDPFKSFIAEREEVEKEKKREPKTYLETVELSQLELIAVMVSPKGNWAMVRDSKGVGYVIRKGTRIGTNGGEVRGITDTGVSIREEYRNFKGELKYRDVEKKVPNLKS